MNRFYSAFRSLTFVLLAGFALASCSDDDDDNATPSLDDKVEYDGQTYNLRTGVVEDYGTGDVEGHYNYDFYVTDGTLVVEDDEAASLENAKILVYTELFSSGEAAFTTGTFTFVQDAESSQANGKHVFENAEVIVDSNNDNILDENDDVFEATGGTVTVSGSNNNYTLDFNLTLNNGKTARGNYSGNFRYFDER
ncbi:hypothetical protein [Pontibacter harenae]|uniref:hypothetical protein n=1 Tax=Pontibacter harenae TaxID=2894083 RepID=UPI001E57B086|nr:hypothetical protein [Pontibacter harenae]MCC9166929.1 hypothetical protein [Pontibacter harenae]